MSILWFTLVTLFWTTVLGIAAIIGTFIGALVGVVVAPLYIFKWIMGETSMSVQPQKKDSI